MAIVMKYHNWPPKGVGTLSEYTYKDNEKNSHTIPGHELGHEYQWDKMLLEYVEGEYTDEEADAVAQLMYDCGIMMRMQYNLDGYGSSGAYSHEIAPAMIEHMQYDLGTGYLQSDWYNATGWMNLMRAELDANRPIIYGGSNDRGEGHQFVFDGYTDTDYFSVNWGWGGLADGYYLLSALDPEEQGTGGNSGGGFIKNQSAVIGVQPIQKDSKPFEALFLMKGQSTDGDMLYGLKPDTKDIKQNEPFNMQFGFIMNVGNEPFNGVAILSLYDKDGKFKQHICEELEIVDLPYGSGTGYSAVTCLITDKIEPLDYIVANYHNNETTEWQRLYGDEKTTDLVVVKEVDGSLENNCKFAYSKADRIITITTLPDISYSLKASDGVEATQGVTDESGIISIDTKALAAGTYQLTMVKDEFTQKVISFVIGKNE